MPPEAPPPSFCLKPFLEVQAPIITAPLREEAAALIAAELDGVGFEVVVGDMEDGEVALLGVEVRAVLGLAADVKDIDPVPLVVALGAFLAV